MILDPRRLFAFAISAMEAKADDVALPVGGQAVIEGVIMKGPSHWGMAVRCPDGGIWRDRWRCAGWDKRRPWNLPVLRGMATMAEMLREGFRALSRSAQIALGEEEELTTRDMLISILVAIVAVVALFVALPLWIGDLVGRWLELGHVGKNAVEGIARGLVFIAYVGCIGFWKDIREVLMYHGAEHKTINAFEAGVPMTILRIRRFSRIHPRCGTSFLLVVVVMSILVFSAIGGGGVLWRVGSRVVLLPLVVGLSYEIIRATARGGAVGRAIMAPALSLQYLTTRVPTPKQLQVALVSLESALNVTFVSDRPGRDIYREAGS
ncbi:MAG: hypothetical protein CSA35_07645 [Dethiosulfovibrio peptidovorans]|nr:MAG: hypothetical protein CSA35_07645 [Dethiosulfovibrio peptidovorans]